MLQNSTDCYFNDEGYCVHTDKRCEKLCKSAMKEYEKMDFKEHYDTFWKRKERKIDYLIKWLTMMLSIIAISISFFNYLNSKNNAISVTTVGKDIQGELSNDIKNPENIKSETSTGSVFKKKL